MTVSVLHIVQHLAPGGIETLVLEMQARDPDCHVVSLDGDARTALKAWPRLNEHADRLHFLQKKPGIQLGTLFGLRALISRLNPRAVHTHHIGPMLYGGLASRLAGATCLVHTEHDAWHLENPKRATIVRLLEKLVRPQMVADADAVAAQLKSRCGIHATTIRNGIDTEKFSPKDKQTARQLFNLPSKGQLVGTAGRLEPVKNQMMLINAFAASAYFNDAHLVIAGDGSQRALLERRANALGIGTRVHFLGRVDRMAEYLSALDLFVLPSNKEGYPLSLLEAQSCGVPVIATDVGGSRDAVCPATGQMIQAGDSLGLSYALKKLDANGGNPRDFVLAEGSIDVMTAQYAGIYGD